MKRSERRLLVLVVVVVAVIAVQMAFTVATGRTRSARLARVKRPASMAVHDQLVAQMVDNGVQQTVQDPDSGNTSAPPDFPSEVAETVAAYAQYFEDLIEIWGRRRVLPIEVRDILDKSPESWTQAERAAVEQAVSERKELVRQLRELAARGGPIHPLDFSKGIQLELLHLGEIRAGVRLLNADAIISAMNGNYDEAVADIIAGMQLGDALAAEPIFLSQLVRIAIYGTINDAIQHSFRGGNLSPGLFSELMAHMDQADNRQAFAESYTGEQIVGNLAFADIREGNLSIEYEDFGISDELGGLLVRMYGSVPLRPWLNMDESAHADIMTRYAQAAELPYYEARPQLDQIEKHTENLPWTRLMTRIMTPALSRACQAQARHEATIDLMQMGLLLEQYQAQQGSYPATLDTIAPGLGGSVPVDPFSGEPYHYYPSDDSFQLYGVGRNLTDDGGRHDPREGDLVWRGRKEQR
jgi:hypothetical protein